ncbi:HAD hydrolase-like protein [Achromobacter xylosoxidans]|uniref:HAD hydrolase-like protein n=1 Tax=Alcaligenes xylosoxydans xylosoxydans TaxID=85698 RepID=UPI0011B57A6D|nr:hypothetical protein [Achromobacter xylosoxidans]
MDDTLLHTTDLKEVREKGVHNASEEYINELRKALGAPEDRLQYREQDLLELKEEFPDTKFGVFTRAPRSYASFVLHSAYPNFQWNILIAYEDVRPTKPYGDGIVQAMDHYGFEYLNRTVLIGDNDSDISSAYNCGCIAVLDKGLWPYPWKYEHWGAVGRIPDAVISTPARVKDFLRDYERFLPELERALSGKPRISNPRFDAIGHFLPKQLAGEAKNRFTIYISGRSFSNYRSISERKKWHKLTKSIEDNKESEVFPDEWVETVREFIASTFLAHFSPEIRVSVVPHRPGRKPRLENFLAQIQQSLAADPLPGHNVTFHPGLFAYREGVKSQHNDLLNHSERFTNVRDHLYVQEPNRVSKNVAYLVIDDVTTTGASLIYASKYLEEAGSSNITCLAMAKNIGNLYSN